MRNTEAKYDPRHPIWATLIILVLALVMPFTPAMAAKGGSGTGENMLIVTDRGNVEGFKLLFIQSSDVSGDGSGCTVREVVVTGVPAKLLEDDDAVKTLMKRAFSKTIVACPPKTGFYSVTVNLWESFPVLQGVISPSNYQQAKVNAAVVSENGQPPEVRVYRNPVAERLSQFKSQNDRSNREAAARTAFYELTRRENVHVWLTTAQVARDPFKWQDKTVAIPVRLHRMLTSTIASVVDADPTAGFSQVLLTNVSSDTFGKDGSAIVVGRPLGRKSSADVGLSGQSYGDAPVVQVVVYRACEAQRCLDYLGWRYSDEVKWGVKMPVLCANHSCATPSRSAECSTRRQAGKEAEGSACSRT
ncbi:hypothetical protein [Acidovorax sp. Root402]|uniref:hypothetical protein n=1 Tax=Acidovorax sp. Root402 TaxID=1736527 RepID=UPI000ABA7084|nr:hypothetical protein [Acidovorax sp. Root402]